MSGRRRRARVVVKAIGRAGLLIRTSDFVFPLVRFGGGNERYGVAAKLVKSLLFGDEVGGTLFCMRP